MTESTETRSLEINRPANVALVAGLLSFIPLVGVVAIIAGLVAGQRARVAGGAGRGRAFAGVVLGMLSLLVWAMLLGAILQYRAVQRQMPAIKATRQFIMLVGSGNVNAAKGLCTDKIDVDRLADTAEQFTKLGTFDGDIQPFAGKPIGDGVQVDYRLPFISGAQIFSSDWVFVDGQPRLTDYRMVTEASTTQPATQAAE